MTPRFNEKEKKKKQDKEVKKETEEDNSKEKQTEIKQIEGEEPQKLEYFSKDELVDNIQDLKRNLKENEEKLQLSQNQANEWKNKYMRLQAEFENTQKRWEKYRKDLSIQYIASTIKSFLPLYDSFKKALENNNSENKALKGFNDQFINILKFHKAEPIKVNVNDPFDYNYHEALSTIERDDVPKNTIIDIVQDGWKLNNEVIRYTKVIISREPKPPEPEQEKKDESEVLKKEEVDQEKEKLGKKEKAEQ